MVWQGRTLKAPAEHNLSISSINSCKIHLIWLPVTCWTHCDLHLQVVDEKKVLENLVLALKKGHNGANGR